MGDLFESIMSDPRAFIDAALADPLSPNGLIFFGGLGLAVILVAFAMRTLFGRKPTDASDDASGATPTAAAKKMPKGKTICRYRTRVLAVSRSAGGQIDALTFTGELPDDRGAVVRRHALHQGVQWEKPFPSKEAFRSVHYLRIDDVLILPAPTGGVEAIDVHSGSTRWSLPGSATLHSMPLAFKDGAVLLVFGDQTWTRIDGRSGRVLDSGRVATEAQLDSLREGGTNRFEYYRGDMADEIVVGDVVIEPSSDTLELRQVIPDVDDGDDRPVFPGPGPSITPDNPNLTDVGVRTMTRFDSSGSREFEYRSAVAPVKDWEIPEDVIFCHEGYLFLPLLRSWGDKQTSALGIFHATSLAPVAQIVYGVENRSRADFDGMLLVDGVFVLTDDDETTTREDTTSHDCLFLLAPTSPKARVLARIPLEDNLPASFFDPSGAPGWSGHL